MSTVAVSTERCLHELFEAQVQARPDALALVCGDSQFTYRELDKYTNQLARHLRAHWVEPGKLVGIYFQRSHNPIIAILAILKAGGAYVPIDPIFPHERIRHIVDEAEIAVVVSDGHLADHATEWFEGPCISLDRDHQAIVRHSAKRLSRHKTHVQPDDLSYVLYTSGTTGRPKGVMTEHRNVVRFVESFNEEIRLTPDDNVYQGFALGFDGSVEEMWMAFSNGATLVVGTAEAAQLGHEAPRLFAEHEITVFSTVPTCLNLIQDDLPLLRLIIVSGEPCPPELVERWARPGRRLLNVYGPTETTVNSTVAECQRDARVTIGKPLRGYDLYVLDEAMQPVPEGEPGELYIGGLGVARGYLNQPELTAKQFLPNNLEASGYPAASRLYRTGDLVQYDENGDLLFLGRIDRQVKVRGFRIELSEIESVLREHPQVSQAVVNVYEQDGHKDLAAYIVAPNTNGNLDRDGIHNLLKQRLTYYMVPSYLDRLDALPMTSSGKVDRKNLPTPSELLVAGDREIVAPRTPVEKVLVGEWEAMFKLSPVSVTDDFFLDLGGYSLLAAEMVSRLRQNSGYEVAIRDVYACPTIERLAAHIEAATADKPEPEDQQAKRPTSYEVFRTVPWYTRWCCVAMQACCLLIIASVLAAPVVPWTLLTVATLKGAFSFNAYVWITAAIVFVAPPIALLLSIAVKWLVIGRYRPGSYPVWGMYYFRWWLATRVQFLAWIDIYAGTPLLNLYYRLMGAKVGRNCVIDTTHCVAFDLIEIGEDTCIGNDTQMLGYRVEDGMLHIGRIQIGKRCFVGIQSCLDINTCMGDDSYLDDLSLLPAGGEILAGEGRRGSPAAPAAVDLPALPDRPRRRHPVLFGMLLFLASEIVGEAILLGIAVPMYFLAELGFLIYKLPGAAMAMFAGFPLALVFFATFVALTKALILPRARTGVYSVDSWYFLRKWSADLLMRIGGGFLYPLYTTLYCPIWLRLMGARIGRRAEISTVASMSPDLVDIGAESFFADGAIIGGRRLFRGYVAVSRNRIGARTFIGNSAVLPVGTELGDGCLLGVLSAPPHVGTGCVPDESEWLGSPPFRLPHRPKVDSFATSATFRPSLHKYFLRSVIDGARVLLPYYLSGFMLLLFAVFVLQSLKYLSLGGVVLLSGAVALAIAIVAGVVVVAIKQVLIGTFRPEIKPLWCVYVWFNELINGLYETVSSSFLGPLMGTPFAAWYFRLLGCKIGKWTFIETDLFSEFDLVEIGDYAALNASVVVQNHLFEDRVMKSSYLKIGHECSIGNMTVVLYDTEMEPQSSIGPLSLLMKGETLPTRTRWLGIPTSQVG